MQGGVHLGLPDCTPLLRAIQLLARNSTVNIPFASLGPACTQHHREMAGRADWFELTYGTSALLCPKTCTALCRAGKSGLAACAEAVKEHLHEAMYTHEEVGAV